MEHKRAEDLRRVADLAPTPLTRAERLERWAELLEAEPTRRLRTLDEIELTPRAKRPSLRSDRSALTIAYADPVLRAAGLASDRLGDATEFFQLSDRQVHRLLCSCMYGYEVDASTIAHQVRAVARQRFDIPPALVLAGLAGSSAWLLYLVG